VLRIYSYSKFKGGGAHAEKKSRAPSREDATFGHFLIFFNFITI
jgi:hypothetical protein